MYFDFAESVGANLNEEVMTEEHYLPKIKAFNKGHLKWLHEHSNDERLCAFAAYERLDNIDYINLHKLAEAL